MEKNTNISIKKIESLQPRLSPEARTSMWKNIESSLQNAAPSVVASPYTLNFFMRNRKTSLVFTTVLLFAVAGGGTAFASNAAKPGDLLFPLDRTLETIQLKLAANDVAKVELTKKFTNERLQELRDIVDSEVIVSSSNLNDRLLTADAKASSTGIFEIQIHVFTDTTVVKLELNDKKFYFESTATSQDGVLADVLTRFPSLTKVQVLAQLDFNVEQRPSRPQDRGVATFSKEGEARINAAVEAILSFLDATTIEASDKQEVITTLSTEVSEVTNVRRDHNSVKIAGDDGRVEIKMDDNGDGKLEIRNGASRIRVEKKNGEVEVTTNNWKQDDAASSRLGNTLVGTTAAKIKFSAEADAFTDVTIVHMELSDDDATFEVHARTRTEVVHAIHDKFTALPIADIDTELDFHIINRASLQEDRGGSASENTVPAVLKSDDRAYYNHKGQNTETEDESSGDKSGSRSHKEQDED